MCRTSAGVADVECQPWNSSWSPSCHVCPVMPAPTTPQPCQQLAKGTSSKGAGVGGTPEDAVIFLAGLPDCRSVDHAGELIEVLDQSVVKQCLIGCLKACSARPARSGQLVTSAHAAHVCANDAATYVADALGCTVNASQRASCSRAPPLPGLSACSLPSQAMRCTAERSHTLQLQSR